MKSKAGSGCVVLCNASGLFANAARLDSQIEVLFESGIDLVFPGEQAIARGAARSASSSDRWSLIRPLNLPVNSPGNGVVLYDKASDPFWVMSLLDGSGKILVEPAYRVLDDFFRNKVDKYPVLINVHGSDYDLKKALAWRYTNSGHQISWFGSGFGFLSAAGEIIADGGFLQPEVGSVACAGSIGGLAPEIWWQRKIDRLPVAQQTGWGTLKCDCTILWLGNDGKAQRFVCETLSF
ncbi:MAG: YmdB family metallophosphoesterase [Candidatus Riflebacteria bacterium]|nr:YmdB family metallophosphoesterase [Candidatus Riflebacteria bacterium]